jgi:hypothetical protein
MENEFSKKHKSQLRGSLVKTVSFEILHFFVVVVVAGKTFFPPFDRVHVNFDMVNNV